MNSNYCGIKVNKKKLSSRILTSQKKYISLMESEKKGHKYLSSGSKCASTVRFVIQKCNSKILNLKLVFNNITIMINSKSLNLISYNLPNHSKPHQNRKSYYHRLWGYSQMTQTLRKQKNRNLRKSKLSEMITIVKVLLGQKMKKF